MTSQAHNTVTLRKYWAICHSLKDSNTILKALEPIQAEVLKYIMAHPQATREEIADSIDGISFGGVKFIIAKLQKKGLLKRVGGRKFGEWLVFI